MRQNGFIPLPLECLVSFNRLFFYFTQSIRGVVYKNPRVLFNACFLKGGSLTKNQQAWDAYKGTNIR